MYIVCPPLLDSLTSFLLSLFVRIGASSSVANKKLFLVFFIIFFVLFFKVFYRNARLTSSKKNTSSIHTNIINTNCVLLIKKKLKLFVIFPSSSVFTAFLACLTQPYYSPLYSEHKLYPWTPLPSLSLPLYKSRLFSCCLSFL